jgi:DNA-binding NarL/FixJ family response regulator
VTSVLIVDDETLVRSGLSMILGADPGIEVVGAVTGSDAVAVVATAQPEVVLLDIRMPDIDGLELLRLITGLPNAPVVAMLTTFDGDDHLAAALRGGAAGFLLKNTSPTALSQMVHTLAAGGTVLAPGVNRGALASVAVDLDARARIATLTPREFDVLRLITEGATNGEIATALRVSLGTVKDDVRTILVKLDVQSRVLAALTAARAGLVAP